MHGKYVLKQLRQIYAIAYLSGLYHAQDFMDEYIPPEIDHFWILDKLFVHQSCRGRHYGAILLDRICHDADEAHMPLLLSVFPDYDCPMSMSQLIGFYERHGFVWYDLSELMYREARE